MYNIHIKKKKKTKTISDIFYDGMRDETIIIYKYTQ